jgi:hypothetical protein
MSIAICARPCYGHVTPRLKSARRQCGLNLPREEHAMKLFLALIQSLSEKLSVNIEVGNETRVFCDFDDFPVLIELLEDAEQVLLAVSLGPVPAKNRERFYQELLQGQYMFQKTGGAALAVDGDAGFVSLQVAKDIRMLTEQSFLTFLEHFLHIAAYWRTLCAGAGQARAETEAAEADPHTPPEHMIRI